MGCVSSNDSVSLAPQSGEERVGGVGLTRLQILQCLAEIGFNEIDACTVLRILDEETP